MLRAELASPATGRRCEDLKESSIQTEDFKRSCVSVLPWRCGTDKCQALGEQSVFLPLVKVLYTNTALSSCHLETVSKK